MPRTKRLIAALAVVVGLIIAAMAFGTSAEAYPPGVAPQLFVSSSTVVPGQTITVSGTNYAPNETVTITLHSDPVVLGTATSDSSGAWSTSVTIPSNTSLGTHTITGTGATGDSASATITVVAAAAPSGPVSVTGVAVMGIGALGLALVIGGAIMLVAGRRRRAKVA